MFYNVIQSKLRINCTLAAAFFGGPKNNAWKNARITYHIKVGEMPAGIELKNVRSLKRLLEKNLFLAKRN